MRDADRFLSDPDFQKRLMSVDVVSVFAEGI
jgi:hypothetical protein